MVAHYTVDTTYKDLSHARLFLYMLRLPQRSCMLAVLQNAYETYDPHFQYIQHTDHLQHPQSPASSFFSLELPLRIPCKLLARALRGNWRRVVICYCMERTVVAWLHKAAFHFLFSLCDGRVAGPS